MSRTPYISKSKFLQGLQCSKLLWSAYNAKHLFPEVDAALQAVFDQGHEVGDFAKRMFPNGIEIDTDHGDFEGAIQLTQKSLPLRRPIFEATISANGGYARADILNPVGRNEWDIIEVKSTTSVKRRKKLQSAPLPSEWRMILEKWCPLYHQLPEADRRELEGHIQVFLAEKKF